jgi:biotin transport system substrate-specific component
MFFGVVWLGFLLHLTPGIAFKLGVAPFLPGEIVKILAAAGIFASLQRWHKA